MIQDKERKLKLNPKCIGPHVVLDINENENVTTQKENGKSS